jgi:type I restriction enzyme S subunit
LKEKMSFPSLARQAELIKLLEKEYEVSEALSRTTKVMNEYHTRLIADVVTGAVDVREAAKAIAEVVPVPPAEEELEIETEVEEEHGTE